MTNLGISVTGSNFSVGAAIASAGLAYPGPQHVASVLVVVIYWPRVLNALFDQPSPGQAIALHAIA